MADFDPYYKWLGIPPEEQPPTHYRLLGLRPFESDPEVIEAAADQKMAYVRQAATGPHVAVSQKLLNQLAAARLCLLTPAKKAAYDRSLQSDAAPPPADGVDLFAVGPSAATPAPRGVSRQRKSGLPPAATVGAAVAGGLVGLGLVVWMMGGTGDKKKSSSRRDSAGHAAAAKTDERADGGSDAESAKPTGASTGTGDPVASTKPQPGATSATAGAHSAAPAARPGTGETSEGGGEVAMASASDGPANLLRLVDPKRDAAEGEWRVDEGVLVSPPTGNGRLDVPHTPPEEYTLTLEVARSEGKHVLFVGIPVGERRVGCVFHGLDGGASGLDLLDGKSFFTNETERRDPTVFADEQPHTIAITVRKDSIHATYDGRTIIDWKGDPVRLSAHEYYGPPGPRIRLWTQNTVYRFSRVTISPPDSDTQPAVAHTEAEAGPDEDPLPSDGSTDLLRWIDPKQDGSGGEWRFDGKVLVSPQGKPSHLDIPYTPPDEYVLTVESAKVDGNNTLYVGLLVGGRRVTCLLNGGGDISGLQYVDGRPANNNETTLHGAGVFRDGKPHTAVFTVRTSSVHVAFDGKTIIDWKGDPERLSLPDVGNPTPLYLFTVATSYRFNRLTIASLDAIRLPVPDAAAQKEAEKQLDPVLRAGQTDSVGDRLALANRLLSVAAESEDDLAVQYVALTQAQSLAAAAGNGETALKASKAISDRFDVNPVETKEAVAKALGKATKTPAQARDVALLYIALVMEAMRRNEFPIAERMADGALQFATKTRYAPFREQMQKLAADVKALHGAYVGVRDAAERLKEARDDKDANLRWGRFLCFEKGDWKAGLDHLAKGGDETLAPLAQRDLDYPADGDARVQIGDDWWEIAQAEKGLARRHVQERAVNWYQRALPVVTGLKQPLVEQKIARIFGDARVWETSAAGTGTILGGIDANAGPSFTLEFWVRTEARDGMLLCKRHEGRETSLAVALVGGFPEAQTGYNGGGEHSRGGTRINDGKWHHIALSKLGGDVQMYVDGEPTALLKTREQFSSRSPWVLGWFGVTKGGALDAKFCRIRISSVARYYAPFEPERDYGQDKFTMLVQ